MMETTAKIGVTTANNEWAVILAGGDGTRLKSLTRHIAGDERTKSISRTRCWRFNHSAWPCSESPACAGTTSASPNACWRH